MTVYNVSVLANIVTQVVGGEGRRVAFKLSGQYSLDLGITNLLLPSTPMFIVYTVLLIRLVK